VHGVDVAALRRDDQRRRRDEVHARARAALAARAVREERAHLLVGRVIRVRPRGLVQPARQPAVLAHSVAQEEQLVKEGRVVCGGRGWGRRGREPRRSARARARARARAPRRTSAPRRPRQQVAHVLLRRRVLQAVEEAQLARARERRAGRADGARDDRLRRLLHERGPRAAHGGGRREVARREVGEPVDLDVDGDPRLGRRRRGHGGRRAGKKARGGAGPPRARAGRAARPARGGRGRRGAGRGSGGGRRGARAAGRRRGSSRAGRRPTGQQTKARKK